MPLRTLLASLALLALASPALADGDEEREEPASPAQESPYATGDDELAAQYGLGDPPSLDSTPPYGVGTPPSLHGGSE